MIFQDEMTEKEFMHRYLTALIEKNILFSEFEQGLQKATGWDFGSEKWTPAEALWDFFDFLPERERYPETAHIISMIDGKRKRLMKEGKAADSDDLVREIADSIMEILYEADGQ